MAFRGRGRGRGGRGRFGGGFLERSSKKEPYILFPEDVILPSLPNIDNMTNEEKLLIRSKYKLEHFWLGSCYHLELEAFPKREKSKSGKEKSSKVPESKKEDVEIERYSDRFKQRTLAKREALESYLKQTPSNFPPELIQGAKRARRATKKLRWDRDLGEQKLDDFAKLEEKYKGNDGEEVKKDESEDEIEPEEGGEYSDEGDYEQEDVILPSLPNIDSMTNEEKLLIRSKYKLEHFWLGLCYHLELEAFSKSEKLKNGKEKSSKVPELKKDVEIKRYSDRFKQRILAKREALESYLKQTPSNFPPKLIQGAKRAWRATKKLRWDRDLGEQKLDVFAKLEEKYKGNDGEEAKKDESEDEIEPEEGGEYSDEGDYEQNRDFDDDDDVNMDDGREEDNDVYE